MSDHPHSDLHGIPDWDAIARYAAGEGTDAERAEMRRALDSNAALRRFVEALHGVTTPSDPVAPTSAEVEVALRSVLARRDLAPSTEHSSPRRDILPLMRPQRSARVVMLRVAAAIVVVAGAGLLLRSSFGGDRGGVAPARAHLATAVGAIDSMTLADGTRILLGPGSRIDLDSGFGASNRTLSLTGDARFDVRHNSARLFTVRTSSATFRDVGTVFAVHSDSSQGSRVVVSEGAVSVSGSGGAGPVILRKGDRATVAASGSMSVERAAMVAEDTAWATGRLVFRDATVAHVAADVSRWYGLSLHVDSALASRRLTATFDRNAGADVGRVIAAMLGGGWRQRGNELDIVPAPAAPLSR